MDKIEDSTVLINEKVQQVPDKLIRYIKAKGKLTGSKVIGGWREGSDIDYILMYSKKVTKFTKYFYFLENSIDNPLENEQYPAHSVAYIKDKNNQLYNLLLFTEEKDYNLWIECTNICIDLKTKYPVFATLFKNKQERKEFFKKLRFTLNKMKYQK